MKIAHFPSTFFPNIGGVEIVIHNLAKEQVRLGHDVTIFVLRSFALQMKNNFPESMPYRIIPIVPKTMGIIEKAFSINIDLSWLLLKQLLYAHQKYTFDLWHFSSLSYQALCTVSKLRSKNIPVIGTCHGSDIQVMPSIAYGARLSPMFDSLFCEKIHDFSLLTAISDTVREEYRLLSVDEKKIVNIPNGVHISHLTKSCLSQLNVRETYVIKRDTKILLTVGRDHPKKGYRNIPRVLKHLRDIRHDIVWVIVGKMTDSMYEIIKESDLLKQVVFVEELGLDHDNFNTFTFPSEKLISIYQQADVFVSPTLLETFGVVFFEAMATRLPIVTTDAPGVKDFVVHRKTGLVSAVDDNRTMAHNIHLMLSDHDIKRQCIQNGFNFVKKFDWPHIANEYIKNYQKVLST